MSGLSKASVDLEWIEEPSQTPVRPELEEFELHKTRTIGNTVLKKAQENLLVPIGLLATTACLTMGLINMRKGNSEKQQLFMRGRIGFQAFTLAAMTLGMYLTQKNRSNKKT